MDKATRALLTADEQELVRATESARLGRLDEDALVELHTRVRRARTKYVKLHRRQAGAQVGTDRARGVAAERNQRTLAKAEVFEEALARVSRSLAAAARRSAAELKAERLAAARGERTGAAGGRKRADGPAAKPKGTSRAKAPRRTPISKRSSASARATGRRAQARRDGR